MRLIIDIPDNKYHTILNHAEEILDASSFIEPKYLYLAVINGTPLPKGHGRLIDADQYKQTLVGYIDKNNNSDDMFLAVCGDGAYHAMCMLKDISTIIEAESEL